MGNIPDSQTRCELSILDVLEIPSFLVWKLLNVRVDFNTREGFNNSSDLNNMFRSNSVN